MDFARLLKSWLLIALGVLIASATAGGIRYDDTAALVVAVILLSLCNIFLKPLLLLFSLPFIILTFGLGIWLINAVLFLLVARLVQGFHVDGFLSALWGALVVSVTGFVADFLFAAPRGANRVDIRVTRRPRRKPPDDDDVIDV